MKNFLLGKISISKSIFVIALILIISGITLIIMKEKSSGIQLYNQAVSIYNEVDLTLEGFDNHPVFPEENLLTAASYFQQAASNTQNDKLKSLAFYNIGTLIARDYLIFGHARTPELNIDTAISMFAEAVRLDPCNEDAKYNLEYLEMISSSIEGSSGLYNSSGVTEAGIFNDKGY